MNRASFSTLLLTALVSTACNGSSATTPPGSSTSTTAGHSSVSAAGTTSSGPAGSTATVPSGAAGMTHQSSAAGASASAAAGTVAPPAKAGSGGAMSAAGSGGATSATAGAGGMVAAAGSSAGGATGAAGGGAANGSMITGTLGALGPAQPVMAGWATTNGLETLVYLSTAPLTCAMMMTQGVKWLSKLPAGSQVIEIVVGNPSSTKTYMIGQAAALGGGEVNYAEGSKSSSTEVTGKTGKITFTKAGAMAVQEGTIEVTAPQMFSGTFHAEWCQGGTEY